MHLLEDSQGSLQPGAMHDTRQLRMDLRIDGLRLTRSEHADRACQDSRACGTACTGCATCRQLNCRLGPLLQRDLVGACAGASQCLPELGTRTVRGLEALQYARLHNWVRPAAAACPREVCGQVAAASRDADCIKP